MYSEAEKGKSRWNFSAGLCEWGVLGEVIGSIYKGLASSYRGYK